MDTEEKFTIKDDNTHSDSSPDNFLFEELNALKRKIEETRDLPEDLRIRADYMLNRLNRMTSTGVYGSEFDTLSRYIDTITSIPWTNKTEDKLDLAEVKRLLDKNHYGMEGVKERILEYLASIQLLKQRGQDAIARSPVLLFVGLQGIGKTTLSISIAEAMGREFVRIAMGALGTVLELRGKSKAFPEAEPGQIIKALIKTQVKNPVILLDEVDKASGQEGLRNDIMAALLEILDPNQNIAFRDHYVDFPVNLSDVMFICSANNTGSISAALMDRMEVIKMPSYTDNEKIVIARDYLLPKVIEEAGLRPEELKIEPNLWPKVVRPFGYDSGIRSLRRILQSVARKVAKEIVEGSSQAVNITEENLRKYLPQ